MSYLIMAECKNPSTAKPFKFITTDENVVYDNFEDASLFAVRMNKTYGDGYARVIAI